MHANFLVQFSHFLAYNAACLLQWLVRTVGWVQSPCGIWGLATAVQWPHAYASGARGEHGTRSGTRPLFPPSPVPRTRSTAKNFNAHTNENQRKDTVIGRQIIVWFVQTSTVWSFGFCTRLYCMYGTIMEYFVQFYLT